MACTLLKSCKTQSPNLSLFVKTMPMLPVKIKKTMPSNAITYLSLQTAQPCSMQLPVMIFTT